MSPKHPTASFPLTQMPDDESADTGSILVSDTIKRLGRLETVQGQMVSTLSTVAESVKNLNVGFDDIKGHIKDIAEGFISFKIDTASYGNRISDLETKTNRFDTQERESLEQARLKAEAILETERIKAEAVLQEARVSKRERRNRLLTIVGTAISSIIVAALVTWLGLK